MTKCTWRSHCAESQIIIYRHGRACYLLLLCWGLQQHLTIKWQQTPFQHSLVVLLLSLWLSYINLCNKIRWWNRAAYRLMSKRGAVMAPLPVRRCDCTWNIIWAMHRTKLCCQRGIDRRGNPASRRAAVEMEHRHLSWRIKYFRHD